ncbi:hypothetical protein EWB00_009896, partial [Schistosoma japonicum]
LPNLRTRDVEKQPDVRDDACLNLGPIKFEIIESVSISLIIPILFIIVVIMSSEVSYR